MISVYMRFLFIIALTACSPARISGTVVDGTGQPISGVSVSIDGTAVSASTAENGQYALDFTPGDQVIKITHPRYFERIHTIHLSEQKPHTLKPTVLVKKPTEDGLFVLKMDSPIPLGVGSLTRDTQRQGPAKKRRFCLDKDKSKPNALSAGPARFADKNARPWRLFKLDGEGCAYRDARDSQGRWVVEYRERPDLVQQDSEDGIALHDVELDKGEYFIADWAGFFVAQPDDAARYTGRWIRVDD